MDHQQIRGQILPEDGAPGTLVVNNNILLSTRITPGTGVRQLPTTASTSDTLQPGVTGLAISNLAIFTGVT